MLSFWWIRHAPVIGNNNSCYGNNEVECDLSDKQSFQNLSNKLPSDAIVYTSELSRSIKTFRTVEDYGLSYKYHYIDKRISEQNLGDYTGMKYNELYKLTKKLGIYDKNWLMKASYSPPNGESYNNLDLTKDILSTNGIDKDRIKCVDIDQPFSLQDNYDIVISLVSMGYHYPVENYVNLLKKHTSDKTIFIFDIASEFVSDTTSSSSFNAFAPSTATFGIELLKLNEGDLLA